MANFVKCPNGHMFDSDNTPQCPHCRGANSALESSTAPAGNFATEATGSGFRSVATQAAPTQGGAPLTAAKTVAFEYQETRSADAGLAPTGSGNTSLRACPTMPGVMQHPTSEEAPANKVFNPVVGWLISMSGADKGRDFRLLVGKNTIGRGRDENVFLSGDEKISRDHATIYYYPKVNEFYIEDHSTHGTYLNSKPIIQRTLINTMDRIEIGDTVLILKSLCDSGFIWDEFK